MFMLLPVVVGAFVWMCYELFRTVAPDLPARGTSVLITGAASGIGLQTAKRMMSEGVFVFAADRNVAALEREYGARDDAEVVEMDVRDAASVAAAAARVAAHVRAKGGLAALVNSAGVSVAPGTLAADFTQPRASLDMDVDRDQAPVIDINLLGVMRTTRAFAELVVKGRGAVVNLASVAGRIGSPSFMAAYAASKHGVNGYSKAIRCELAAYGVRVYAIEPGFVRTPMVTASLDTVTALDLSRTRYKAAFPSGDKYMAQRNEIEQNMIEPAAVADDIYRVVYSSAQLRSHRIVSNVRGTLLFTILSTLPSSWQDRLVLWRLGLKRASPRGSCAQLAPPIAATAAAATSKSKKQQKRAE